MYRRYFILAAYFLLGSWVHAQVSEDQKQQARDLVAIANEAYFKLKVIIVANEQYAAAAELDPENVEANFMAGLTFLETNNKSLSTKYLLRVYEIDPEYRFDILYMIGNGFQYGLEFEKAIEYYDMYLEKLERYPNKGGGDIADADAVVRKISECENGIRFVNNPQNYVIENVGGYVNSEWDDFAPVLNANEDMMVFTTRRQDGNLNPDVFDDLLYFEDIFISTKSNGEWSYAQNIGETVNSPFHDSNLALSADGTQLFIYKSDNGGDIYVSELDGNGAWQTPAPLNNNINSSFSENSVSLSPDGNTLFFSSDRPNSVGQLDIFYSQRNSKGEWGVARSVGESINTPFDEDGPFIDYDGKTLYFSSKGHNGMGGYDIYKSVYDSLSETWSEPVNLGYPMNTPDNDVYFVSTPDGQRGYYASAREGGLGFTDIYHIHLAEINLEGKDLEVSNEKPESAEINNVAVVEDPGPEPEPGPVRPILKPVRLLVRVIDGESGDLVNANISLRAPNNSFVPVEKRDNGVFEMSMMPEAAANYKLSVEKRGYMFNNQNILVPAAAETPNTIRQTVTINPVRSGSKVILRNVYFNFGSAYLKPESKEELQQVKRMLEENPTYFAELSGHTDNIGDPSVNKQLSLKRAQAVVNWLIQNGISEGRLFAEGYGEERPIASNDDEKDGRELNRRVEFKLLKLKTE
ncbi:MAG TPA: hypothetical protein DDY13_07770 [Cytophagales bacterium]|jgi:outer membrane protein OmpA-like peptidoglycan-associated protein|nr:hypothetical protein [Cytophagales bacterium]